MNDNDRHWMTLALALAERGRGLVEPNPLVGAVLVRDGHLVGEGWHQRFGEAHAEVHALRTAGNKARGATLYVTLEPCCHHGKTPPCTDELIAAGVASVVAALADPFPAVAGQGAKTLQAAGIPVTVGLLVTEARKLNAPYLTLLEKGRPYVHAKWAMSLDGKIATKAGDSRWISNETSRRKVHALRGRMDGILVGSGTVLADDPLLTARPPGPRCARRIVLDGRGRIPVDARLVRTAREIPTVVSTGPVMPLAKRAALEAAGCVVVESTGSEPEQLKAILRLLAAERQTNLLVEGGAGVLGSFLDARLIDEVHLFLAPLLIGGVGGMPAMQGQGVDHIREALRLSDAHTENLDGDLYVHGSCLSVGL